MSFKTKYHSYATGRLPVGCQHCVKGSKMVLFVTGLCPRTCAYCPISDAKHNKDIIYADEWPISSEKDIMTEARLIGATGAGITGGDPLMRTDRVVRFITLLKKKHGKKFHIHLYTSFNLVQEGTLKKLHDAGLDEIRFHPDLDEERLWKRIELVRKFDWDIGIEVPVIPGKITQTKKMISYMQDKVDFLNMNELEFADNSFSSLSERIFKVRNPLSYSIKGSREMALQLLRWIKKNYPHLPAHFCTATLKDKIQMANRLKRRAKNAAGPYDIITEEGMLFRGAVYSAGDLDALRLKLMKSSKIPAAKIAVDTARKRILIDPYLVKKHGLSWKKEGMSVAYVEEYPTFDCIPVETNFI